MCYSPRSLRFENYFADKNTFGHGITLFGRKDELEKSGKRVRRVDIGGNILKMNILDADVQLFFFEGGGVECF